MSFKTILGHKHIVEMLKKSVVDKCLPNAFIFSGPDGVGKMLTAFELAKSIHCQELQDDSCGKCPACLQNESGNNPNLLILDKGEEKIKIEEIREFKRWLSFKSSRQMKIIIINNAENITQQGCNAFLKTLEEPPENSMIILVSSNLRALLPTIVSRCRIVRFNRLSNDVVKEIIEKRDGISEEEASRIAKLYNGSAGTRFCDEEVACYSIKLLEASLGGNLEYILKETDAVTSDKSKLNSCLDFLMLTTNDLALIFSGDRGEIVRNQDIIKRLVALSEDLPQNWPIKAFDMLKEAKYAVKRNANKKLLLEELLIGMRYAARTGR